MPQCPYLHSPGCFDTQDGMAGTGAAVTGSATSTSTGREGAGSGIDPSQPIVFQVGRLGPDYWDWVNRPEPGKPRFFRSSVAENCSKVKWWVVPLVWLPFFSAVLWYGQRAHDIGAPALLAWLAVGVVAWQGMEYAIHRWVFHATFTSYWGLTFHFLFHGCHHKYPMDAERLVFPPLPASWFIAATYAVLASLLPARHALPLFAGIGYGYVAYDCLHYAIHHSGKGLARRLLLMRYLQTRHLHHHYKNHALSFGISSTYLDLLLGTSAAM